MTYVVKRIDEQMYGCEEPAPGAEALVDVTLVAPDGVKWYSPTPMQLWPPRILTKGIRRF